MLAGVSLSLLSCPVVAFLSTAILFPQVLISVFSMSSVNGVSFGGANCLAIRMAH